MTEVLVSAAAGAVVATVITVLSNWAYTAIREASLARKEQRAARLEWWSGLRSAVFDFEVNWAPWSEEDHPNFDEPREWLDELQTEIRDLRARIGPSPVRDRLGEAVREIARVLQLEMQYMGQSRKAYDDFTASTADVLEMLKKLSDEGPADKV